MIVFTKIDQYLLAAKFTDMVDVLGLTPTVMITVGPLQLQRLTKFGNLMDVPTKKQCSHGYNVDNT